MSADKDFCIISSDDEFTEEEKSNGNWHPEPERIVELYTRLQKGEIMDLEWQSPGRRSPTINAPEEPQEEADVAKEVEAKVEPDEFDFGDDFGSQKSATVTPQRGLRNTPGSAKPKGSGHKRVARLDKVMFNIRKYRQLDEGFNHGTNKDVKK